MELQTTAGTPGLAVQSKKNREKNSLPQAYCLQQFLVSVKFSSEKKGIRNKQPVHCPRHPWSAALHSPDWFEVMIWQWFVWAILTKRICIYSSFQWKIWDLPSKLQRTQQNANGSGWIPTKVHQTNGHSVIYPESQSKRRNFAWRLPDGSSVERIQ